MKAMATLVNTATNDVRPIELLGPDKFRDTVAPITVTREVVFARRDEVLPDEGPFCAFWAITPDADTAHEYDKVFGGMNKGQRLFAIIFQGANMEPELKAELVNLDGVSVLRIELDPHYPDHVLLVPERFIP